MTDLLLHPATERQLKAFSTHPSHAVTLVGPPGSGKGSLAKQLAAQLLNIPVDKLPHQAYVRLINSPDSKAIGIEAIRDLEHFLSLKVPSTADIQRIVIIEDAHLLTVEAQNAFLKTLEEPPAGTVFILTSAHERALLPTIRSRSPRLTINRPAIADLQAHFKAQYGDKEVKQALLISGGLPGLAAAILGNDDHPLLAATDMARNLLRQTTFERLAQVDILAKDRTLAIDTLFIMQQMAHLSLQTAQGTAAKNWRRILTASYDAEESLLNSGQPKLVLTDLFLHL